MSARTAILALVFAAGLGLAADLHAGGCPSVPPNAFAFINPGDDDCPANPGVRWFEKNAVYDCDFFSDADKIIDCAGDPSECAGLCRAAADAWNVELPGRFSFVEASEPVAFCDDNDGKISVGGTDALCDGTGYGDRVLAVTLSIFFSSGPQTGRLIDANITVNNRFRFSQEDFQATLAHEFGHALGLSHPDQCGDDFNVLMRSSSAFDAEEECFVVDPTAADVNGAIRVYPDVNPVPTPTPGLCGDADLNGSVSVLDGVQTLRAAAELSSSCTPSRCDVDGNGSISVSDGVNVLRGAAGLSFTANCQ
jgi:hypothetical protein